MPLLLAAWLSSLACQHPLACHHRCAGSRPLPASVRPRLPSSSSPPAIVPYPSASPRLPLLSRRLSSLALQRPPSPAVVVVAAAANDGGGRAHPHCLAAALAIPSTSVVQRCHNHCRHQAVFATTATTNLVLFGRSTFSHTEESVTSKSKAKQCNLLFTAQLLEGNWPDLALTKNKKNYRHPIRCFFPYSACAASSTRLTPMVCRVLL
jgi:hypothetical protein